VFDENGIFHSETFNQPQTGALAGLGILNEFKSYDNSQKAQGEQQLQELMKLLSSNEGDALLSSPQGEQAFQQSGIDPDQFRTMNSNTPQGLGKSYIQSNPNASSEDIARYGMGVGAVPIAAGINMGLKSQAEQDKNLRAKNSAFEKVYAQAAKIYNDKNTSDPNERAQRAGAYIDAYAPFYGLPPEQTQQIKDKLLAGVAGQGIDPMQQADIDLKGNQAENVAAKTAEVAPNAQSQRNLNKARQDHLEGLTQLIPVRRQLLQTEADIKASTKNGTAPLTPSQRAKIERDIAAIEKQKNDIVGKYLYPSQLKDPAILGTRTTVLKDLDDRIKNLKNIAASGATPAGAPPGQISTGLPEADKYLNGFMAQPAQ
jgi:hypothetical protein